MTQSQIILEVCVDTIEGLHAALSGGADRIELCAALSVGGLTPGPGLMAAAGAVQARTGVPVMAMIRAHIGGFEMSGADIQVALGDIAAARGARLAGVVIGASGADGRLDTVALGAMMAAARDMDVTLHRCFDLVPDLTEAMAIVRDLGIGRILTSGGAVRAPEGLERLAETVAVAGDAVSVMPGSGVTAGTVASILALGVREVHASCASPVRQPGATVAFGFAPDVTQVTDADVVRQLKAALD